MLFLFLTLDIAATVPENILMQKSRKTVSYADVDLGGAGRDRFFCSQKWTWYTFVNRRIQRWRGKKGKVTLTPDFEDRGKKSVRAVLQGSADSETSTLHTQCLPALQQIVRNLRLSVRNAG